MAFLFEDGNVLFSAALALMLMIAVMEGVLTLIGFGFSQLLDSLLPDIDLDADLPDGEMPGGMIRFLGWLKFGQVPALVLLILFLTLFGVIGISVQLTVATLIGTSLPSWLAAGISLIVSLPVLAASAGVLQKYALKDESAALARDEFVGSIATITIGEARLGSPAEARFSDQFGTTHYVMVEPGDEKVYQQGQKVLLAEQKGSIFRVIEPPLECL